MYEDNLGSELAIVLTEAFAHQLASPQDALAQIALSTGVMRVRLFGMIPDSMGIQRLSELDTWPRKNVRAFAFNLSSFAVNRFGGTTAARRQPFQRQPDVDSGDIDLDTFLASCDSPSVTLPIMVDDEWQGFIQLHEGPGATYPERVWERAEIASLEQVVSDLSERISQQKHIEPA
jgi:hypothetical protein